MADKEKTNNQESNNTNPLIWIDQLTEEEVAIEELEKDPDIQANLKKMAEPDTDVPYPYNLLITVFNCYVDDIKFPDNVGDRLEKIFEKTDTLEPEFVTYTTAYYKDGRSLADIGREYGVPTVRVLLAIQSTYRRLRHPRYSTYLRGKKDSFQ